MPIISVSAARERTLRQARVARQIPEHDVTMGEFEAVVRAQKMLLRMSIRIYLILEWQI